MDKADQHKAETEGAAPSQAEQDAEVLLPDREVDIGGETITVREFRFAQGMKLSQRAAPLIRALHEALPTDGSAIDMLALEGAFGTHADITTALIAESTGKPTEWIDALGDEAGRTLLLTFWSVNRHFFLNRMMTLSLNRLTGQVWPSRWRH